MAEAKKLGELLKEAGLIDDFQLQTALSHQRNWGGQLGSILIEHEFIQEKDLARVISDKLRIPYVDLFEPGVSHAVIKLIKPDIAKKYAVMPAKKEGGELVLAMSDPLDIAAIDTIRFITGLTIKPALALESEIRDAIRKYYDGEDVVRKQVLSPLSRAAGSTGKMELVRGSDLTMPKDFTFDAGSPILSRDDNVLQVLLDNKARIDALITLLVEKGAISREELMSMIYQKKMGL